LSFSFLLIGIINQCAKKESESFRQKKLQTRMNVDKTILRIDKEIMSLRQQLPPDASSGVDPLHKRIIMLEDIRNRLLKQTHGIDTVKEAEWNPLKDRIKSTISQVDSNISLWENEMEEESQTPPYPFPS